MNNTVLPLIVLALLVSAAAGVRFVGVTCANPALMPAEPPAGYTIQGNGDSPGVWLQDRSNVVIKNLNIRNFQVGIDFSPTYMTPGNSENCSISNNTITGNTYGISLIQTSNCYVAGNYLADNTNGVRMQGSDTFRNNRLERNQYGILDNGYSDSDIDESNTIDGKPIYYWVNQYNVTVPSDAGLVVLKNCSGITVENLRLKGNENGLFLSDTNDSTISGNTFSDNINGIMLRQSFNNTITGNEVTRNAKVGIEQ